MVTPFATAMLAGLGVGAVHYLAHTLAGNEMSFDEAGVSAAGIAATIATIVAVWMILNLSGVA